MPRALRIALLFSLIHRAAAQMDVADAALCSSKNRCSDCVTTPLQSDSTSNCVWYTRGGLGYCDAVPCRDFGCGDTECAADSCSSGSASCAECLGINDSCAWAGGLCLDSCSVIADVPCYSSEAFEGMTVEEICQAESFDQQDAVACASQSSCTACVNTTLSSGSGTCQWIGDNNGMEVGFCVHQCTTFGCGGFQCDAEGDPTESPPVTEEPEEEEPTNEPPQGESGCSTFSDCQTCLNRACAWTGEICRDTCQVAGVAYLSNCYTAESFVELPTEAVCQIVEPPRVDYCPSATTCLNCMESEVGCAWTNGECLESCEIADVACYQRENYPDLAPRGICDLYETRIADEELCSSLSSCEDCVSALLSDGESNCRWFSDASVCASACGMDGCGDSSCELDIFTLPPTASPVATTTQPPPDCSTASDCFGCLSIPTACAWTTGVCLDSCQIADAACYQTSSFPENNIAEICEIEEISITNKNLCNSLTTCDACTTTSLTDDSGTCQWFSEGNYCDSECGMQGCGSEVCDDTDAPNPSPCSAANGSCSECLGLECAWAPAIGCLDGCDMIADTACFTGSASIAPQLCAAAASDSTGGEDTEAPITNPPPEDNPSTDGVVDEDESGVLQPCILLSLLIVAAAMAY